MGKFSVELDAIMATRDVALAGVIRDTGISRAAFFKYRNGSRLPSDIKTVERLADVLQLNFDERRRFREGYLIDQIGEYKYRGMMAIEKLLCTPAGFLCAGNAEKAVSGENSDEETGTALSGMLPVTMKIMSVMRDGLRKGDVTVFETISSDSMFRVIGQVKGSIHEHELTHIMAMNGSDNASAEDRLYNVERLGSIIRTLCSSEGYRPYYYYASLSTLRTLGILTTNFILTRDTVLCYAEDYSSAVVLREPENVALYGNIAAGVMRIASPGTASTPIVLSGGSRSSSITRKSQAAESLLKRRISLKVPSLSSGIVASLGNSLIVPVSQVWRRPGPDTT